LGHIQLRLVSTAGWVLTGIGSAVGYIILAFIVSAVIAATTKTAETRVDVINERGQYNGSKTIWLPSGYFSVFAGVVWPLAVAISIVGWSIVGSFWVGGKVLQPAKRWNQLVHKLNPGAKVKW